MLTVQINNIAAMVSALQITVVYKIVVVVNTVAIPDVLITQALVLRITHRKELLPHLQQVLVVVPVQLRFSVLVGFPVVPIFACQPLPAADVILPVIKNVEVIRVALVLPHLYLVIFAQRALIYQVVATPQTEVVLCRQESVIVTKVVLVAQSQVVSAAGCNAIVQVVVS